MKAQILYKIWDLGKSYKSIFSKKGKFYLPNKFLFLFAQYSRLKRITQPLVSLGCGALNGHSKENSVYVFEYGPPNLKGKYLIPNFGRESLIT